MALEQQQQADKPKGGFGEWLSKSVQSGREFAAAGLNRLRGAFSAEESAAMEEPETSYEKLPKEMQLAGAIGFENPDGLDFARLPDSFRAIALRVPKGEESRVRDAMESKLAIPCSTTFGGNADSTTSQLTYVTSAENVASIRQTLHMLSVNGILVEAESQPLMARTARGEVIPLCNFRLPDLSKKESRDLEAHSFGEGREGLERKGISMRGGLSSNHVDLSPASEASGAAAVKAYRKMRAEHVSSVPPIGPGSYILIDTRYFEGKLQDDPNVELLKTRLRLLDKPPASFVTQIDGKILVGSGSAKGASSLLKFANELSEDLGKSIAGFVSKGEIVQSGQDKYHITGFPDTSAGSELSKLLRSPGLRLSREFADLWSPHSTSRESTVCKIATAPIEGSPGYVDLTKCIDKISLFRGGPRICVGQRDVINAMVSVLKNLQREGREVRVIDVVGNGGSGKSRTFMRALEESGVYGVLTMSEDFASGQKYHTIVNKISQATSQFSEDAALSGHPDIQALAAFDAEPLEEKLRIAADPKERAGFIRKVVAAYEACAKVKGKVAAAFDDFQYADVASAELLGEIMEQLEASESPIVVAVLHRPGEENCPEALADFFAEARKRGGHILDVNVRGLPLREKNTAMEYVENMEFEHEGREGVTLADLGKHPTEDWCRRLGALASTHPLRMNDLLALMLTDERLVIDEGRFVNLTQEGNEALASWEQVGTEGVESDDFKIVGRDFYLKLQNPDSQRLLQCMSLLRGVATLGQIKLIAREVLDIPKGQIDAAIAELIKTQCILEVPLEAGKGKSADDQQYQIRSKTLSAYADNAVDPTLRATLNSKMFSMGLGDVFTLGKDIAGSEIGRPEFGDEFWKDFGDAARAKFSGAEARNDVNNAYLYADSIMEIPLFGQLIEAARHGALPKVENAHRLAVEVVLTRARNAFYTGRFEVSKKAMTILEEICVNNRSLVPVNMLLEIYLINFNTACALSGYAEAHEIYSLKLNNGKPLKEEDKIICELRLANKKGEETGDFSEAQALYAEHELLLTTLNEGYAAKNGGHPSPISTEAYRLSLRAKEGQTKSEMNCRVKLDGVDELLKPEVKTLDDGQKRKLFGEMIRAMREGGIPVEVDDQILQGEQPLTMGQINGLFVAINGALLAKNGIQDGELRYSLNSEEDIKGMFSDTCKALKYREFDNTMAMQPGVLGIPQAQAQLEVLAELEKLLEDQKQHPRALDGFGEIAAREQRARTLARLGDHHKALKEFVEVRRLADLLNLKKFAALTAKAIGDLQLVMASVAVAQPVSKKLLSTTVTPLPVFDRTHITNALRYYQIGIESAGELDDPYMQLAMRGEALRAYSMQCMNFLSEFERVKEDPRLVDNLRGRATTAVTEGMKIFDTINEKHNNFGDRNRDKVEARYCVGGDIKPIIDLAIALGIMDDHDLSELTDSTAYPYLAGKELDVGIWNASRMTDSGPGEGAQEGLGLVKRRYENLQSMRTLMHDLRHPKPQETQAQ